MKKKTQLNIFHSGLKNTNKRNRIITFQVGTVSAKNRIAYRQKELKSVLNFSPSLMWLQVPLWTMESVPTFASRNSGLFALAVNAEENQLIRLSSWFAFLLPNSLFLHIFFLPKNKRRAAVCPLLSTAEMGKKDSSGTFSIYNFKPFLTLIIFATFSTTPTSQKMVFSICIVISVAWYLLCCIFPTKPEPVGGNTELESTPVTSLDIIYLFSQYLLHHLLGDVYI